MFVLKLSGIQNNIDIIFSNLNVISLTKAKLNKLQNI